MFYLSEKIKFNKRKREIKGHWVYSLLKGQYRLSEVYLDGKMSCIR